MNEVQELWNRNTEQEIKEIKETQKAHAKDILDIKSDIKDIKYDQKTQLNLITKIDKTIEANKEKWSSNINTWLVGGIATIIGIIIKYLFDLFGR